MKKRRMGFAVWLLLAACLYFFENNVGTRIILLCSALFPLLPPLRKALFEPDEPDGAEERPCTLTVHAFVTEEAEEPGEVRPYVPGDPVRRIHWKLSAKKDALLVREETPETETIKTEEKTEAAAPSDGGKRKKGKWAAWLLPAAMLLCLALLLLLPEANRGAKAICNRVFAASERMNAYAYDAFPVPEDQGITLAAALLFAAFAAYIAFMMLLRSRWMAMGLTAACTLFQAYFGLPFPPFVNVLLYGLLALLMMKRPFRLKKALFFAAAVLAVSVLTLVLLPGVDAGTEAASETVRDHLSRLNEQITEALWETPMGETETRHVHTLALQTGENEAGTDREYRPVTVEEEKLSLPHWVDYLKIFLLLLLSTALLILPFAPFALLNARKMKALEERKAFSSEDAGEAVRAVFRQVIRWLEETGHGGGNRLYREWTDALPAWMPEGYAARFAQCAGDFEEAAYSCHALPEEKRRRALELLGETEAALWQAADWKQRLRIRYWVCLCE